VVQDLIALLIQRISDLQDISEQESHHLSDLLCLLVAPVVELFSDSPNVTAPVDQYVPAFSKYLAIINILNLSMVAIVERWESGDFKRLFNDYEIRHWMVALFSDTPLRATNLKRIVP